MLRAVAIAVAFLILVETVGQRVSTQALPGLNIGPALPTMCTVGSSYLLTNGVAALYVCSATDTWTTISAGGGSSVPAGAIVFVDSGACPAGYAEDTSLSGKTVIGTVTANGDVGTTGGADAVTPAGSVGAPTFTGNSVASSAITAGTPAGTNATGTVTATGTIAWPVGVPTNAAITAGTPAGTISALTTGADSSTTGGVAKAIAQTPTFTGSALATHTHVISWPAGVPTFTGTSATTSAQTFTGSALGTHSHTTTATGTNSAPAFAGTSFDNRSAFIRVIGCKKT